MGCTGCVKRDVKREGAVDKQCRSSRYKYSPAHNAYVTLHSEAGMLINTMGSNRCVHCCMKYTKNWAHVIQRAASHLLDGFALA